MCVSLSRLVSLTRIVTGWSYELSRRSFKLLVTSTHISTQVHIKIIQIRFISFKFSNKSSIFKIWLFCFDTWIHSRFKKETEYHQKSIVGRKCNYLVMKYRMKILLSYSFTHKTSFLIDALIKSLKYVSENVKQMKVM